MMGNRRSSPLYQMHWGSNYAKEGWYLRVCFHSLMPGLYASGKRTRKVKPVELSIVKPGEPSGLFFASLGELVAMPEMMAQITELVEADEIQRIPAFIRDIMDGLVILNVLSCDCLDLGRSKIASHPDSPHQILVEPVIKRREFGDRSIVFVRHQLVVSTRFRELILDNKVRGVGFSPVEVVG